MRAPVDVPGIDRQLLLRYPVPNLRALGERLGLEDARAGALAGPEYVTFALGRLVLFSAGLVGGTEVDQLLTPEEQHEFVAGLILGLDEGIKTLRRS